MVRVCVIPLSGEPIGLDVTVKSGVGLGFEFAPTWAMVMAHKRGTLSDEEYTKQYIAILDALPPEVFTDLYARGVARGNELILQCYCRAGKFCHAVLLTEYLLERHGDKFTVL